MPTVHLVWDMHKDGLVILYVFVLGAVLFAGATVPFLLA